jgi:uncharacterized protein (TIGR02611 family)
LYTASGRITHDSRTQVRAVVSNVQNRGMIRTVIGRLREQWREFSESEPGHRFQDRYRRRQVERSHALKRIFLIVFGTVLALGSLFLAPLPGPGFATVFVGLAILAGELLPAARFLDWAEVRLRRFGRFVEKVWRSSLLGKIAVVGAAALIAATVAYVAYRLLFAG